MSNYTTIPQSTRESIDRYIKHGIPTGGFLRAVMSNNLREAVVRADCYNMPALAEMVSYLYMDCPPDCWGSAEKVERWLAKFRAPEIEASNA